MTRYPKREVGSGLMRLALRIWTEGHDYAVDSHFHDQRYLMKLIPRGVK